MKIYQSRNYGNYVIAESLPNGMVRIEFIDTGYCAKVRRATALYGGVKDRLLPTVYGVGFIGDGNHRAVVGGRQEKAYKTWSAMLMRCYSEVCQERQPAYKGCSVCKEWHNFQNFAEWFDENYIEGYQLDKDIKVDGNKLYSPETCTFVSVKDNLIKAKAKSYKFKSPKGDLVNAYNLSEFCRRNGLNRTLMANVSNGKARAHQGWTRALQQEGVEQ